MSRVVVLVMQPHKPGGGGVCQDIACDAVKLFG